MGIQRILLDLAKQVEKKQRELDYREMERRLRIREAIKSGAKVRWSVVHPDEQCYDWEAERQQEGIRDHLAKINILPFTGCPFCGTLNVEVGWGKHGNGEIFYCVDCEECECSGPRAETPMEARDKWENADWKQ